MSKQCPYFKFYSDEWNSGLITVEPMEAQGLFINICSLLWSKGELTIEHICKRFSGKCQADVKQMLSNLEADGLIKIANAKIEVDFIKEALKNFELYSEQQAKKGRKGGLQRNKSKQHQANKGKERKNIEEYNILEKIYISYPKQEGRGNALKAIEKALTKINADDLLAKVQEYSTKIQWKDKQFIPLPATWFNQERWNDDPKNWERDIPKPAFKEIPDTNLREELFL